MLSSDYNVFMSKTNTELLEAVQDAIYRVASFGQDVQFEGRRVTEADLERLQKVEAFYARRVAKESRGGIRMRGGTPVSG